MQILPKTFIIIALAALAACNTTTSPDVTSGAFATSADAQPVIGEQTLVGVFR